MNASRFAQFLRELADKIDEEEGAPVDVPAPPKSKPRKRCPVPLPSGPTDDVSRARARRILRNRGIGT